MTIYIVDIEPIDTRYTAQWKVHLPEQLKKYTNHDVQVISGEEVIQSTTPGAFLNFGGTNVYKSKQLEKIGEMFCKGEILDGDYFLYTDAWNPTVIQLKYMAELLDISIHIGGLWHAGSYDPHDFLGRMIGNAPWVRSAEHSMFSCYDDNFFATQFHINMFANGIFEWNDGEDWYENRPQEANESIQRVGWPMEYMATELEQYRGLEKRNLILFPHRIAPEKQLDIFNDLKMWMPEYEFVVCQEQELSKHEYHTLLGEAKVVFSANLQETLGISWYEGALVGALPFVPDRLSYSEMVCEDAFKYTSEYTQSRKSYDMHRKQLVELLRDLVENYETYQENLDNQVKFMQNEFFSGERIYKKIGSRIFSYK
jgi:hypothetical protein